MGVKPHLTRPAKARGIFDAPHEVSINDYDRPMAAKKKPGKNIPNAQRHTVQRLLRLPPEVDERLQEIADEEGVTVSGAVALLIEEHDGDG